jgi:hypothetical protein
LSIIKDIMWVAVSLGILVGLASLVSAAVILLAPAVAISRFLRRVRVAPPACVVVRAVPREGSLPTALASAQPQG